LVDPEFLKKVVFQAVGQGAAFCLVRAAVVGSDRVQCNLQNVLRVVCISPSDREIFLIHPDDALDAPLVYGVMVIVKGIAFWRVPGGGFGYNVKVDAVLIHGRSKQPVHVANLCEFVLDTL